MSGPTRTCGSRQAPDGTAGRWAVCLSPVQVAAAGILRLEPGIDVCESADAIWLRGDALEQGLEQKLRELPGARRFRVLDDGQLLAVGCHVPSGWIPDGPWTPLARWLGAEMPVPRPGGRLDATVPIKLCRSSDFREPSVLLTSMELWESCATCAQVRLDRWRFAAAGDGRVVVQGQPLPSLPGQRLVEHDGIAVPAGWFWSPPVEPGVIWERMGFESGDLALWHVDGSWDRIPTGDFVRPTPAAIRATARGFSGRGLNDGGP